MLLIIMNYQLLLTLLVELAAVFATDQNNSCVTPNGENATCVPIQSCKVILDAVTTNNSYALEFAKDSHCGFVKDQVCCGTSGYSTSLSIFDIFTESPSITNVSSKLAVIETKPILADFSINQQLPNRSMCGLDSGSYRVIGGTITELNEFPWMAALEYEHIRSGENAGIKCGGSVINNKYILTAAHCLVDIEFKLIVVRLGEWRLSTDPDCEEENECADEVQKFEIDTQIPHRFYSKRSGDNDIGLLRLKGVIKYTDYIRPICMPPTNLPIPAVGTRMTVTGWGATENGTSSDLKLKVKLPLLTNDECNKKLENQSIGANQLCAGGERKKDACRGDSGGPLMRTYEDEFGQKNQWYQEGVVAWGVSCGKRGFPAIYTRVTRYIGWIITNTKED